VRWVAVPHHVLGHRCLRDFDAQLAQLAVNPRCTPVWVGCTHSPNQFLHLYRYWRATLTRATLPRPVEPKSFAMPGNDRLRFSLCEALISSPPKYRRARFRGNDRRPTAAALFRVLTLEDEKLMAQARTSAWSATRLRSESRRTASKETRIGIIAKKPIDVPR
jgi:hypothetical protein